MQSRRNGKISAWKKRVVTYRNKPQKINGGLNMDMFFSVFMQIIGSALFSFAVFIALAAIKYFFAVSDSQLNIKFGSEIIEKAICFCMNVTFFVAITTTCGLILKLMLLFTLS